MSSVRLARLWRRLRWRSFAGLLILTGIALAAAWIIERWLRSPSPLQRARELYDSGRCEETMRVLQRRWHALSHRPEVHYLWGRCKFREEADVAVLPHYRRARDLTRARRSPSFQHELGWLLFRSGELGQARRVLASAAKRPEARDAVCTLSSVQLARGELERARASRERCERLDGTAASLGGARGRAFGLGTLRVLDHLDAHGDYALGYIGAMHLPEPPPEVTAQRLEPAQWSDLVEQDPRFKAGARFEKLSDFGRWWYVETDRLRRDEAVVSRAGDGRLVWRSSGNHLRFGARSALRVRDQQDHPWTVLADIAPRLLPRIRERARRRRVLEPELGRRRWLFVGRYLGVDVATGASVLLAMRIYTRAPDGKRRRAAWCLVDPDDDPTTFGARCRAS